MLLEDNPQFETCSESNSERIGIVRVGSLGDDIFLVEVGHKIEKWESLCVVCYIN